RPRGIAGPEEKEGLGRTNTSLDLFLPIRPCAKRRHVQENIEIRKDFLHSLDAYHNLPEIRPRIRGKSRAHSQFSGVKAVKHCGWFELGALKIQCETHFSDRD